MFSGSLGAAIKSDEIGYISGGVDWV